jgi:hypothetical protein
MNAKPSFRPVPCPGGWQILVTWPDARSEQLGGYSSEAEAVKWINNVSDKWADRANEGQPSKGANPDDDGISRRGSHRWRGRLIDDTHYRRC